jgi:uncharacterized protein
MTALRSVYVGRHRLRYVLRMATGSICPTCRGRAAPHAENPAHPFCSGRCKLADLSNWFNERYVVPSEPANPDELDMESDDPKILH